MNDAIVIGRHVLRLNMLTVGSLVTGGVSSRDFPERAITRSPH